jgi:hypothetical protein
MTITLGWIRKNKDTVELLFASEFFYYVRLAGPPEDLASHRFRGRAVTVRSGQASTLLP